MKKLFLNFYRKYIPTAGKVLNKFFWIVFLSGWAYFGLVVVDSLFIIINIDLGFRFSEIIKGDVIIPIGIALMLALVVLLLATVYLKRLLSSAKLVVKDPHLNEKYQFVVTESIGEIGLEITSKKKARNRKKTGTKVTYHIDGKTSKSYNINLYIQSDATYGSALEEYELKLEPGNYSIWIEGKLPENLLIKEMQVRGYSF